MKLCLRCNQYFADGMTACPRDNSALESIGKDPLIGALINDRYVVDSVIGKGSSGIVYKATRLMMGREVAVKVLHSFLGADSGSLDRVLREFAAASKLRHPHIITLWEHGITDDQQPYLVMDYLEGGTLADLIKERKYLHPSRALPIVEQVCDALAEAHSQDIVHRDIKPENIVLEEMGDGDDYVNDYVKVLDFGIADVPEAKSAQVGRPKTVAGSPAYMSPEQCQGMPLDARSDIYSMAVMVFEMLTGERPFQHEEHRALMLAHVTEPPIKLSAVRSDLKFPEELENVIAKALSKKPDARYSDINEFWRALKDSCKGIKSPPPAPRTMKKTDSVKVDAFEFMPEERLTSGESVGQVIPWGEDLPQPPPPPPLPSMQYANEAARALAGEIGDDLWALEPQRDEAPSAPAPLDPEKWLRKSQGQDVSSNGESSFESGWGEDPSANAFKSGQPPPPPPGYSPLPGLGITPTISPMLEAPAPARPSVTNYASSQQPAQIAPPPPPAPPAAPQVPAAAPQNTPPLPNPALQPRRPLVQPPSKGGPAVPPVLKSGQNPVQPPAQPAAPGAPASQVTPPGGNRPAAPNLPGQAGAGAAQPQRIGAPAGGPANAPKPPVPAAPPASAPKTQSGGVPAAPAPNMQPPASSAIAGGAPPVPPKPEEKKNEINDAISRISSAMELNFGDDDEDTSSAKVSRAEKNKTAAAAPERKRADQTLIEPVITEDELLTRAPRDIADEPAPPPPPPPPPAPVMPARAADPPAPALQKSKPLDETLKEKAITDSKPIAPRPPELTRPKRADQTLIEPAIDESELLTRSPKDVADLPQPAAPPPPPPPPPPPVVKPVEQKPQANETKPAPRPDLLRPKRPDQTLIEAAISEDELLTKAPKDIADDIANKSEEPPKTQKPDPAPALKAESTEKPLASKPQDSLRPKRHDQTLIEPALDESELLMRAPKDIADEQSSKIESKEQLPDFLASAPSMDELAETPKSGLSMADRLAQAANKSLQMEKESQKETAALPEAHESALGPEDHFEIPDIPESFEKPENDFTKSAADNFLKQDVSESLPAKQESDNSAGMGAAARLLQAASGGKEKPGAGVSESKTGLGAFFAQKNSGSVQESPQSPEKQPENPLQSKTGMQSLGSAAKLSETKLPAASPEPKTEKPEAEHMEPPIQPNVSSEPAQKKSTGLANLLTAKLAQVQPGKEEDDIAAPAAPKPSDSMTGAPPAKPSTSFTQMPAAKLPEAATAKESKTDLPPSTAPDKPKAKNSGYFSAIQSRTNMPAQTPPDTRPEPPKRSRTDLPAQSFESAASASFSSDFNASTGFNADTGFNSDTNFKTSSAQDRLSAARDAAAQPTDSGAASALGDEKMSSAVSRLMEAAKRKDQDASAKSGGFSTSSSASLNSFSSGASPVQSGAAPVIPPDAKPDLGSAASRLAAASGDANDALTSDLMNRFLEAANRGSELKQKASAANAARGEAINREMNQPASPQGQSPHSLDNAPQIDIAEQTQERLRMAMESTGKHAARPAPPKMPDLSSMRPSDLQLHQLTQHRGGGDLEINLDAPGKKASQTRSRMRSAFKNQGMDIRWIVLGLALLIACGAGYWFILKPSLDKPATPVETTQNPAQQSFAEGKFTKTIDVLEKKEKKSPLSEEEEDLLHHARVKQAEVLAKGKRFAEAKKLLKKVPQDSAHQAKVKELLKKYRKLRR